MVTYKKMSLFDAEPGSILVHACNAMGVWGSGIARECKRRFPESYIQYADWCEYFNHTGECFLSSKENGYYIAGLITSENYGEHKDTPEVIIIQTILALENMFIQLDKSNIMLNTIYCNKFNSGLFALPWEKTEAVLEYFGERYGIEFVVCDPDL